MEHVLYLLLGYIDVVIDHQLIADAVEILAKQAVVVERADEIFHHFLFLVGEVLHIHLLLQLVVEGCGVSIYHFFVFGCVLVAVFVGAVIGHLVILSDAFQCLVELVFSLFLLRLCLVGIIRISITVAITAICTMFQRRISIVAFAEHIVWILTLQCRIIVQFGIYAFLQFGERHFQELHLQYLLCGELLKLL